MDTIRGVQLPKADWLRGCYYWQIVKYMEAGTEYSHDIAHRHLQSSTFIQCDIKHNKYDDLVEALRNLKVVQGFNPGVDYGLACVKRP